MARKRERLFAGFGALLFLVTSSALTIIVIVSLIQQSKSNSTANNSTNSTGSTSSNVNKLQGTKLANFNPVASIPKLQEIDTTVGTGATVTSGESVTVDYTGAVAATGIIF